MELWESSRFDSSLSEETGRSGQKEALFGAMGRSGQREETDGAPRRSPVDNRSAAGVRGFAGLHSTPSNEQENSGIHRRTPSSLKAGRVYSHVLGAMVSRSSLGSRTVTAHTGMPVGRVNHL